MLDDCHRAAGQFQGLHESHSTDIAKMQDVMSRTQHCSSAFGQMWAADNSDYAQKMRAEGAALN